MHQGQLKILVVDDNKAAVERVKKLILEPNGYQVETAYDGADALFKALTEAPDLIVLDLEMPKLNGLEVLRQLRERRNQTPVILMTAFGSERVAVEAFRLEAQDYLIKPFAAKELLDTIERIMSNLQFKREQETLTLRTMQANQEFEQYIQEFGMLYQVSKSITALMEPDKLLDRIVEAAMHITRSEACSIIPLDPKTGQLDVNLRREFTTDAKQLSAGNSPPNPDQMTVFTQSVLTVPLQVGQKVVGVLSIRKRIKDEIFTLHDHKMLLMLADYAAIAINNMHLLQDLQQSKEREKQQIRGLFERYVSPTVVEQMLTQQEDVQLGGYRQQVTVLFADVRGFSTFSSGMQPEILVQILNQYMRVAADAVLAQEGTLDKFMGDAVMAFFNAPVRQIDHPIRAIRAAYALRESVTKLHKKLPKAYRLKFGIGVGVGEAVVGNIGTRQMMNYTVIGDAVNKVKRLQENAQGGQILIDETTYEMVKEMVSTRYVGDMLLKGQERPEPIYEVTAVKEMLDRDYPDEAHFELPGTEDMIQPISVRSKHIDISSIPLLEYEPLETISVTEDVAVAEDDTLEWEDADLDLLDWRNDDFDNLDLEDALDTHIPEPDDDSPTAHLHEAADDETTLSRRSEAPIAHPFIEVMPPPRVKPQPPERDLPSDSVAHPLIEGLKPGKNGTHPPHNGLSDDSWPFIPRNGHTPDQED